jgi:poly(A) polymerase
MNNSRTPTIIPRDNHTISRKHISEGALKVIARLRAAGYQGFLVGGSVRDLLLGGHPKDFDVATDARPEQIRELFRSSRIIGRRFKIVHVRFGSETIEVTTFRGSHSPAEDADSDEAPNATPNPQQALRSDSGMLLRDNVYGTLEEDAIRRDFTINALYYTTENFAVYDYTNGMRDIEQRLIRIIGDPETRYREDPVRMLRAVRFAARLGFTIEEATARPLQQLAHLLTNVSAARMFDEVLKLVMTGHGEATFRLMQQYGLSAALFPATTAAIEAGHPLGDKLILHALHNTDARIAEGKPVTPAFIYAALLWPALDMEMAAITAQGVSESLAIQQAIHIVLDRQQRHTAIPRRFSQPMREIWELQWRLPRREPRRIQNLIEHPRLRAAYDFLLMRELAGEALGDLGTWWTEFLGADEEQRAHLLRQLAPRAGAGRKRRPRRARTEP